MGNLLSDDVAMFVAVVNGSGFTAAARTLRRDVSVVSRRVKNLEERLGVRLLDRTTRYFSVTDVGRRFYEQANTALAGFKSAVAEARMQALSGEITGTLRVSLPVIYGQEIIVPILSAYCAFFPTVRLEISLSDRYVDLIGEGFDLVIRIGGTDDNRIIKRQISSHERCLFSSPSYIQRYGCPDHPLSLRKHSCLIYSDKNYHDEWHFSKRGEQVVVRTSGAIVANDRRALVQAALSGMGIVMCAKWSIVEQIKLGSLIRVIPDWEISGSGGIYMLHPHPQPHDVKLRSLIDWLEKTFE